jgi:hypothetical protein
MLNGTAPLSAPEMAFTPTEMYLLAQLVKDGTRERTSTASVSFYLTKLAQLGGYLARAKDPPPGKSNLARTHTPHRHPTRLYSRC